MKTKINAKLMKIKKILLVVTPSLFLSLFLSIFLLALLFSLFSENVYAQQTPRGIDGRVYEIDGLTEVFSGIPINITNTGTGEVVQVYTGIGSSGRYSVALNWSIGSHINVTVSNPVYSYSRNITLSGVIHDFDLLLNMSIPNFAPEFRSIPLATATQGQLYEYVIVTFDWNNDEVNCSVFEGPVEMVISENVLNWIPNSSYVGEHDFSIECSDGVESSIQNFTVKVFNVNNEPIIISLPITEISAGQEYSYEIFADDPDFNIFSYELVKGPSGMIMNDVFVEWSPTNNNVGNHEVSVRVTDLEGAYAEQNYTLSVIRTSVPSSSSGSSSAFSVSPQQQVYFNENVTIFFGFGVLLPINNSQISSIVFIEIEPRGIDEIESESESSKELFVYVNNFPFVSREKLLDRFVYKYLEIILEEKSKLRAKIVFKVNKKWLSERNLDTKDVLLLKFSEETNTWEELVTDYLNEEGDFAYFASFVNDGFSLFAISHTKQAEPKLPEPSIIEFKQPFTFIGKIKGYNVKKGLPEIIIVDSSHNEVKGVVMFVGDELRYQVTINSLPGEKVDLFINGKKIRSFILEDKIVSYDINLFFDSVLKYLKYLVALIVLILIYYVVKYLIAGGKNKSAYLIVFILTFLILSVFFTEFQVSAQGPPTPKTVAGTIFNNNSVGAENGIPVVITNFNISQMFYVVVNAPPVPGLEGAYSASINGTTGDYVRVRSYNSSHWGETNGTLTETTTRINVTLNRTRNAEMNITILSPDSYSSYNVTQFFNVSVNASVLGANGIDCDITINISNTSVVGLASGTNLTNELGNINIGQIFNTWFELEALSAGDVNISVVGVCSNSGVNLQSLNFDEIIFITVYDNMPPLINLINPQNNTENKSFNMIDFVFNVSSSLSIPECSLIIDGQVNATIFSVSKDVDVNITVYLDNGNYEWAINCTDSNGFSSQTHSYNILVNVWSPIIYGFNEVGIVTLNAGSTKNIQCNFSVEDGNGFSDINAVYANFHSATVSSGISDDNNSHYSNTSCMNIGSSGNTSDYSCTFQVYYYALNGTWYCNATASDYQNLLGSNISNSTIDELYALNVSSLLIDYGSVSAGSTSGEQTIDVINLGNRPINLSLLGYGGQNPVSGDGWSMLCPSTNIPIENHRFGFSSDDYFSKTSLSSTSANSGLNILKQTNPLSLSSNSTYWQIQVPGMEIALCNGTVRFIAGAS